MIEQKVVVHLTDDNLNELGILSVSSIDYRGDFQSKDNISNSIELENVPIVDEPDALTPIQYCPNIPASFANDSDKIEIYQEILTAPSEEALLRIKARTRDIYNLVRAVTKPFPGAFALMAPWKFA